MMRRLYVYKDLLRIRYSTYPMVASLTGTLIGIHDMGDYDFNKILLSTIVILLLWWGGMVTNQILDVQIDRKAISIAKDGAYDIGAIKENFPIARGAISIKESMILTIIIYLLSFFIAYYLNIWCFVVAITICFFTQIYNKYFKFMSLWGSLFFASLISSSYLMGSLGANHVTKLHLLIILSTIFYHTGVHIFGCIKDYDSDKQLNINTFAVNIGIKRASLVGVFFLSAGYLIAIIPAYLKWLSPYYVLLVIISLLISLPSAIKTVVFPSSFMGWKTLSTNIVASTILYGSYILGLIKFK
ncbi:MAG: UbiA prenyltransferase family protein [bacterium]